MSEQSISADIAIVGGGPVGLTLAVGLVTQGFRVVVADALAPQLVTRASFDGRCSAIAFASGRMLRVLGIWADVEAQAMPILDIRVSDGRFPGILQFHHEVLGDGPLGYMVENTAFRQALVRRAQTTPGLTFLAPDKLVTIETGQGRAVLHLESGKQISAPLVVGADGRGSPTRQHAGIQTTCWSYGQTGIVVTVDHENDHNQIAWERFYPSGPFAILPLSGRRSAIVWSAREDLASEILNLDDHALATEIQQYAGDALTGVRIASRRWSYPLGLQFAHQYIGSRLALVGDAAHAIHPVAGQGLNMGFRDVAAMIEVLTDARRLGLDIGGTEVLRRYERWRRSDNILLGAMTDSLVKGFSNNLPALRKFRRLGLGLVNRTPPLKRLFMAHARGTLGKLPRLLDGRPV